MSYIQSVSRGCGGPSGSAPPGHARGIAELFQRLLSAAGAPGSQPGTAGANGAGPPPGGGFGRGDSAEGAIRGKFHRGRGHHKAHRGGGGPSLPGGPTGATGGGTTGATGATGGGMTGATGMGTTGATGPTGATGGTTGATDPVEMVGPAISVSTLQDGLQPSGATGIADNQGNSVSVAFGEDGTISGITTTNRSVVDRDADGNVTSFGSARYGLDSNGTPQTASSSLAQGPLPVEPEPTGQLIEFLSDQPQQPVLDGNSNMIGFADAGFAQNNGKAVRVTVDANGDIDGFEIEERRLLSFGGPDAQQSFVDLSVSTFDLTGRLIARAVS